MDIDWFLQIGLGYLGLTPEQFWTMRLKYFFLMLKQKNETEENMHRFKCELVRRQTAELINIQLKREDRISPKQLWKFPWDSENYEFQYQSSMTDEEINEQSEKLFAMLPDK